MHTEILQSLGLPKNEAKIYEALLMLGNANVSVIANTAKVNRRNVYDSLKNLIKRRLVVRVMGEREQQYQAQNPEKLRDTISEQRKMVMDALPDLQKAYKANIPEEQIFVSKGREGIKNFWGFILSQKEPEYFIGGKGAWHDPAIENEWKGFSETARKNKIFFQGIFDYEISQTGKDLYSQYDEKLIRFFPKQYSTNANYDICGNRMVFFEVPKERSVENVTLFTIYLETACRLVPNVVSILMEIRKDVEGNRVIKFFLGRHSAPRHGIQKQTKTEKDLFVFLLAFWIPASAGMTAVTFLNSYGL